MKISTRKITELMGFNLMTQKMLAEAAGVSKQTINVTLQRGSCSVQTAGKIAKALGVDAREIVGED